MARAAGRASAQAERCTAYPDVLAALGPRTVCGARRGISRAHAHPAQNGRPFFIDKMPNNFPHIGFIHLILPNAKIIDARRHPLGCCFSTSSSISPAARRSPTTSPTSAATTRLCGADGAFRRRAAGPRPSRASTSDGRRSRDARSARCSTIAACRSRRRACGSTRTTAPCAPPAPNRCASRSSREGVDQWRNYEPWLGPLKDALGPVLERLSRHVPVF